jgi:thymidine kinase
MGSDSEFDTEYTTIFNGRLELIIGNMFSGKSTELIRRINREKSINKKIIVINYFEDNRYSSNSVTTHDQTKVNCLKLRRLSDFDTNFISQYDSFFIDEGQFFPDLYIFVKNLVDNCRKHVIVSGLDGDSNRHPFGEMVRLIPICDTLVKLHAYCKKCNNGTFAPFTMRLNESKDVIDIGGSNKYIPVCRTHYLDRV